jgi:coenzyme F420-reducing hydrogenase beta subunit
VATHCYAAKIDDQNLLSKSSSGAIFSFLAQYMLDKGGVVAGAAWCDDLSVRHVLVDTVQDLPKLQKSKYLQSYTGNVYRQVEEKLKENVPVLFSGLPCQTAGLRSYLGKDYRELIVVDLLCGQAPSAWFFEKYLEETFGKDKVAAYEFRNKSKGWNGDAVAVTFTNGKTVVRQGGREDDYQFLYHSQTMRPPHCDTCLFAGLPRSGDLSIGDFWGVELPVEMTREGMSVIVSNTAKGENLLKVLESNRAIVGEFPLAALGGNGRVRSRGKNWGAANREKFYSAIRYMPFKKICDALRIRHFDIGIYGWWDHENFGSILTYFALHRALTKLGYSILMIHEALGATPHRYKMPEHSLAIDFANRYYICSKQRTFEELPIYNRYCDTFIVGGDQMWNNLIGFVASDNFLCFANRDKRILSYSTSFGAKNKQVPPEFIKTNAPYLRRFSSVSVREDYAVELARKDYGVTAECVLDAVFLLDVEDYGALAKKADFVIRSKYLLAFILDATENKLRVIREIADRMELEIVVIPDAESKTGGHCREVFRGYRFLDPLTVENFLFAYQHASYVVTDSFHGSCFTYIFRKDFSVFYNERRGIDRFHVLYGMYGLENRRVYETMSSEDIKESKDIGTPVDFSQAERTVDKRRVQSLGWLKDALQK